MNLWSRHDYWQQPRLFRRRPLIWSSPDQTITAPSVIHTRAFGAHTVSPGNVNVAPASLVHTRAFGTPTVVNSTFLSPNSVVHSRAFGSHTVTPGNVTITTASVVHTRAFGTLRVDLQIQSTSVVHARAFGSHTVSRGNVNISPAPLVHARAFGVHVVQLQGAPPPPAVELFYATMRGLAKDPRFPDLLRDA